MILESTYGDRDRDETEDPTELFYEIVSRTALKGGKVVVPGSPSSGCRRP
jgi:Cft2 family RNA processing exonuclease